MEHKRTPGPWAVNAAGTGKNGKLVIDEVYVYAPGPNDDVAIAADIIDPDTGDPSMANARLIAAAPDLLEALIGVLRVADRATVEFDAARAAIAKATQSTPA